MCELKNTIKFSFSSGAEKPNVGEVVAFVKALNARHDQIEAAYRMAEEKALFIKFKSEQSMLDALTVNSDELIFHYGNGAKANVHMSHAQECIFYVRVYDLPPEIPDQEITSKLSRYGNVKRVVREKFPVELGLDAYSGVRGVYMDVQKEIPMSLHFLNRKGNIYYPGNKDKCFLCKEEGHRINLCPKRKSKKRQQERGQSGSISYASAVSGGAVIDEPVIEGVQLDDRNHEPTEEEMPDAAMPPTAAGINNDETRENEYQNHPVYQLASRLATEIKKRKEETQKKVEADEAAKIKSPPRKKKNFSLYNK